MEHTVRAYDNELDAMTGELARMGGLAEVEVADAIYNAA
jgi:phosphate transport system protein